MLFKNCPFTAEGLAFAIASINVSKFSCNFASSKETFPIGTWIMFALSSLYSILPADFKDSSKKTLSQKVKYSYSSAENTIETYNGNGELSAKKIITQNGKKHTENTGGILVATEYNSIDQPLKSILYLGASNGSAASQTTYQYNKYGDILQKNSEIGLTINYKDEHHITTKTYKYIYDSHQNWICRKTYNKNEMK